MYTCVHKERDKKNNNIISCTLKDPNGSCIIVEKNKLKKALRENKVQVDNLYLDAKGSLREKDNLIDEYIKSCKCLGIIPLTIEKYDTDYVIVDINDTKNSIKIPPFVTGIYMDKKFSINSNKNDVNKNQIEIFSTTNEQLVDAIKALFIQQQKLIKQENYNFTQLYYDLNKLYEKQENVLTDSSIEDKIDKISELINELESQNKDDFILDKLNDLKTSLEVYGKGLVDFQMTISPKLTTLSSDFSQGLSEDMFTKSQLLNIDKFPKFNGVVKSKEDYWCNDKISYNKKLKEWKLQTGTENIFLPYSILEPLKGCIEYYYTILVYMHDLFKKLNQDEIEELFEFKNNVLACNCLTGTISKDYPIGTDTGYNYRIADTALMPINVLKGTSALIYKGKRSIDLYNKYKKIYDAPNEALNNFYYDTDKDIAILVIEGDLFTKKKLGKFMHKLSLKNYIYKDLLKFFTESYSGINVNFTDDIENRITIAYIIAKKVIRDNLVPDIKISPNLYQEVEDLYFMNRLDKSEYKEMKKLRVFYNTILLSIMCTVLLLLGFNERFIYDQIYLKFRKILGSDCYKVRLIDLDTMDFDVDNY